MPNPGRRRHASRRKPIAQLIMLVALLVVISACSTSSSDKDSQDGNDSGYVGSDHQLTTIAPKKRKPAPKISGPKLTGSGTIDLREHTGKVVVVNVWGSWCAPCRKEAPDLRAANKKTADKAQFIGIDSRDSGKAAPRAFVRTSKIKYPSIYDPDGAEVVKFSKVPPSAIPSTLVIDRKGRVAARVLGTVTRKTLVDMINDVASGK